MRRILSAAGLFIAGLACGLVFTYGPIHAQSSVSENDIMSKLDEISKGQKGISDSISSMKEDIQVIRIRVTQMQ